MKANIRITADMTPVSESVCRFINSAHTNAATQRAADFLALPSALADCTPRGRLRSQALRNRLGMEVASSRPQPEAQHYAI